MFFICLQNVIYYKHSYVCAKKFCIFWGSQIIYIKYIDPQWVLTSNNSSKYTSPRKFHQMLRVSCFLIGFRRRNRGSPSLTITIFGIGCRYGIHFCIKTFSEEDEFEQIFAVTFFLFVFSTNPVVAAKHFCKFPKWSPWICFDEFFKASLWKHSLAE